MKSNLNIAIAQYGTSNLKYLTYTKLINNSYCEKNNYQYILEDDDEKIRELCKKEEIAFQWYKVFFIKSILAENPELDYVLFLDLDAIISKDSFLIQDIIDENYNIVMTNDVGHHSLFNTGVILVKNCEWSRDFFELWWNSKSTTTGRQVKKELNFEGGMHKPDNCNIFKNSLWHEQTVISYLCKTNPDLYNKIKTLPNTLYNHHIYNSGEYIFHAFAYNFDPYKGLKTIYDTKVAEVEDTNDIKIVYFVYCTGKYLEIVESDLNRIQNSGLYEECSRIFLVLSIPDPNNVECVDAVQNLVTSLDKVEVSTCTGNKYEHYGIQKAWEESHKFNGKLLYFHAKGVTGFYSGKNKHSDWKKQGDESFVEMLKHFMITDYKTCIDKLQEYDEVCVSDSYARGWPSGNFWWVNTPFLRNVHFPFESSYDRWACEYWLNRRNNKYSTFQIYDRFFYRDKFTFLPEQSYKDPKSMQGKKISLNYAKLVTLMEPENENDMNRPSKDHAVDFTDFVQENLAKNAYKGFDNIFVSFDSMGRTIPDPLYGVLKSLVISFNVDGDDTEYRLVGDEGARLTYFIDNYTSVGYDFDEKTNKTIREELTKLT